MAGAPVIFGILNLTEDSFSDGGAYLDPQAALAQARRLTEGGADVIDIGAAASNVAAKPVGANEEIRRLGPVIDALAAAGVAVSIDSFEPTTQRFALSRGVAFLNDIEGFAEPALYPELAAVSCRLVVMHAIHGRGRAQQQDLPPAAVLRHIDEFFAARLEALERAGIARDRLIIDPGMGFFLSSRAEASFAVLAGIAGLRRHFGLPVMVSVSRKSFLAGVTGRTVPAERGAATLAAELFAAAEGADYIRTHDPAALHDGLAIAAALRRAGLSPAVSGADYLLKANL
ncbi:MAG TPA: dihydropteroate synthase [Stellaceae bacterium]|nr:dihydropteroate synthase [Stellaceae bacterium]